MSGDEFKATVERILGENEAVEDYKVGDSHAKVKIGSEGTEEGYSIVSDSALEGYDALFRGTKNGFDMYAIKDESPGDLPEEPEKVTGLAERYRSEARSRNGKFVSFGEWNLERLETEA